MLGVLAKYFQDVSILRRLLFAVVFLNPELPMFWGVVVEFATAAKISKTSVTADQVKTLVENLQTLNSRAFATDNLLNRELISLAIPGIKPLGYILISPVTKCVNCGSQLQLRKDRHSSVTIYDHQLGSIPGAHFHKLCQRKTCQVAQYYGYYTHKGCLMFNEDWESLQYFGSSQDTFFCNKQTHMSSLGNLALSNKLKCTTTCTTTVLDHSKGTQLFIIIINMCIL